MERIDDNVFVAGEIADSASALSEIKLHGIKTVFNIRLDTEAGYVDLGKGLADLGVDYRHCPIDYDAPTEVAVDSLLAQLDTCAKPCLLFCAIGLRAAAMGIAWRVARDRSAMALNGTLGPSATALMGPADTKMLDDYEGKYSGDSQLKAFVASYVATKVSNCAKRPGQSKICDSVFLAGQLSEEELNDLASKGFKSVLNMREPCEVGQFGLGMLAKEKDIVEGLGLKYVNIPVPREGTYKLELCQEVSSALEELVKFHSPVMVHCRSGSRAKSILTKSVEEGLLDESPCRPFAAEAEKNRQARL